MRRILVTGMSGSGKSSALAELARRGFRTVDTDEAGWTVEDTEGGRWWDEDRIARLLAEEGPTLYVSGTVTNQGRFYGRFDAIVLLSAPADVVLDRISTRTTNDYGKALEERELIVEHLREVEPQLRATCTHEIDATLPLSEVVDRLAEIGIVSRVPEYDIHRDDKFGQLSEFDVGAFAAEHEPWFNQTLTSVNDSVVRLGVLDGEFHWHKHERDDEFFIVLDGRLEIEIEGREAAVLGPRQAITIPRGVLHRPIAHGRTVVLMVEPAGIVPTGD